MTIKLSILVTFCNQSRYIRQCLDSILSQNFDYEYEILVGLDGNNDIESDSIISEYLAKYTFIKLFKIDNSTLDVINIEKASNNRTNLLINAKGEYICFMDGDDYYCDDNRFQKLVRILDENPYYIGVAHDFNKLNEENNKIEEKGFVFPNERKITAKDYMKNKTHIFSNCFIFRNIFLENIPADFNENALNDSSITMYMLKYGDIYYFPEIMLTYRVGIESIFQQLDFDLKKLYALLMAEVNHQINPVYEKYLCKRNKKLLRYVLKKFKNNYVNNKEIDLIIKYAKENNCYFTYNILKFSSLKILKKIKFFIRLFAYFCLNIYSFEKNIINLYYFRGYVPNFGDELNFYLFERILNKRVKRCSQKRCDYIAIGSVLHHIAIEKKKFLNINWFTKPINVFGSGFIAPEGYKNIMDKFIRKVNILALRGAVSKTRMEKILNKNLSIPMGDTGLLCNKLIDVSKISKKYKAGIIFHYLENDTIPYDKIDKDVFKIIDLTKNPIYVLKELAECEVIFSSAMHGLILADALGIPNCRFIFSDLIIGGDYKFKDYYSIFSSPPLKTIDCREIFNLKDYIDFVQNEYPLERRKKEIICTQEKLLSAWNNHKMK